MVVVAVFEACSLRRSNTSAFRDEDVVQVEASRDEGEDEVDVLGKVRMWL